MGDNFLRYVIEWVDARIRILGGRWDLISESGDSEAYWSAMNWVFWRVKSENDLTIMDPRHCIMEELGFVKFSGEICFSEDRGFVFAGVKPSYWFYYAWIYGRIAAIKPDNWIRVLIDTPPKESISDIRKSITGKQKKYLARMGQLIK